MIFQAVVSVLLILVVLLQFGKGAEAGLMSSASDSMFSGGQQGNIMTKITIVLSVLFLGNSIFLASLQSERSDSSILDGEVAPVSRPLNMDALREKQEKAAAEAKEAATKADSATK